MLQLVTPAHVPSSSATSLSKAAALLFQQEIALHDARQTGVAQWITAAESRLHDAIVQYEGLRNRASRTPRSRSRPDHRLDARRRCSAVHQPDT